MVSCQGRTREGEPVPSARRLRHNLAIISVSALHVMGEEDGGKSQQRRTIRTAVSQAFICRNRFYYFCWTMTEGVKGQRARTVYRSLVWPPTSHPYCPERAQRLLSNFSWSALRPNPPSRRGSSSSRGFESDWSRHQRPIRRQRKRRQFVLSNGLFSKM